MCNRILFNFKISSALQASFTTAVPAEVNVLSISSLPFRVLFAGCHLYSSLCLLFGLLCLTKLPCSMKHNFHFFCSGCFLRATCDLGKILSAVAFSLICHYLGIPLGILLSIYLNWLNPLQLARSLRRKLPACSAYIMAGFLCFFLYYNTSFAVFLYLSFIIAH